MPTVNQPPSPSQQGIAPPKPSNSSLNEQRMKLFFFTLLGGAIGYWKWKNKGAISGSLIGGGIYLTLNQMIKSWSGYDYTIPQIFGISKMNSPNSSIQSQTTPASTKK